MKFTLHPLALALAASIVSPIVWAQDPTNQESAPLLEPIVATPARLTQALDNVLGDVTLIDSVQLAQSQGQSMVDILSRQPGMQIYQSGGPQTVSGVYIRGASPAQSLVMLNGIRLNESNTGSTYWNVLDPNLFDRVEIVRGSASSLYGSNAMGGVINLLTTPQHTGDRATTVKGNIGIGSHGTFKTNASISGASHGFDYFLAGGFTTSDGYNATTPEAGPYTYNTDKDGYDSSAILGNLAYTLTPGHQLSLNFFNSYNRGDYDAGYSSNDTIGLTRQQAYSIESSNQLTDWWQSQLKFSFSKVSYDNRAPFGHSIFGTYHKQFSWQNNFFIDDQQTISTIFEHHDERVHNTSAPTQDKRLTNSVALLYQGDFDRHHLQASVRHDNISQIGSRTTGSIAYAYDISSALSVGLGYNTGFRAPTFADLYTPLSWGYQGNPQLRPEKSRNLEMNLKYQTEDTSITLSAYQGKYKDLINPYVCDAFYNCTSENTERATVRGLSIDATQRYGNTTLSVGADFMNPKDERTGKTLARRAKQVYRAGISHQFNRLELGADYLFVAHRYDDSSNSPEKRMGGYGLVNLRADYEISKNFHAQFNVNNLFNKKYQTAYGYRKAGTNFFLNLAWQH